MLGLNHRPATSPGACSHAKALPRWDNVDDMGHMDRVSRYFCAACDRFIEPCNMCVVETVAGGSRSA